jgi:DNA-binding Lrp family transcriptional regulator
MTEHPGLPRSRRSRSDAAPTLHRPGRGGKAPAFRSGRRGAIAWRGTARGRRMRAIFVMIKCEMGAAYRVARQMADTIEELSEMHSISGQYDLMGKFYLEPEQDIGLFVVEKLQTVPGVKDTYTLQTFNAFTAARG